MRKSILSATVLAAILAGGFAVADETNGTIKSVDDAAKTITLDNGIVYHFNDMSTHHEKLGGYLPGDEVTIVWDGEQHEASAISPDFSGGVTGKIKAVNEADNTVTLDDGMVYTFKNDKGDKVNMGGFKAGDLVTILSTKEGDMNVGRSIATQTSAEVTGKVKAVDQTQRTVTLEDGKVYTFEGENGMKAELGGYKVGDMVTIDATDAGHTHWGNAISPANG